MPLGATSNQAIPLGPVADRPHHETHEQEDLYDHA